MEYDFYKTTDTGAVEAKFNSEHEALGRWLTDEVGSDPEMQARIQNEIRQFRLNGARDHVYKGREWTLILSDDEVEIIANNLLAPTEETDMPDIALSVDNVSGRCGCGVVDFQNVFDDWCAFAR